MLDQLHSTYFADGPFVGLPRKYFHCVLADPAWHDVTTRRKDKAARHLDIIIRCRSRRSRQAVRLITDWGFRYSSTAFPDAHNWLGRKKDHGRAEAMLIALFAGRGAA
jgi:hypothetical protein